MKYIFTLLLLPAFVAYAQTPKKATGTQAAWKTLKFDNYSIQYPSTWMPDTSRQMGTKFILLSPVESPDDKFRENVNLVTENIAGRHIDLNTYAEAAKEQLKARLQVTLLEGKKVKKGEGEYYKMIYSADQSNYHLKFQQYYWVTGGTAYVLTFTAEINKFAGFKPTADKIQDSFKFHEF